MPVLLQRLYIQLTADRKRFGVLCAALGVGLLLWARLIIVSNVPRTAVADDAESQLEINAFESMAGEGSGPSSSRTQRGVMLERQPMRDPFVISTRHFPQLPPEGQMGFSGKSHPLAAEEAEKARARHLAVLYELVHMFRLEAVMLGEKSDDALGSMAVINGRTWRLGELIPAVGNQEIEFELVEIKPRSVMLQFEESTFELNMPGVQKER